MNNNLHFVWSGGGALLHELCSPIDCVYVEKTLHDNLFSIVLCRSDGVGLRIQSQMHDVAERREVGVLEFSLLSSCITLGQSVRLPSFVNGSIRIFKWVINESGVSAESGITLEARDGQQITIIAGASPYSLAVKGLPLMSFVFEPEYPLESYLRVQMTLM